MNRFLNEAHTIAALNHPNILTIHDFGEHNGCPYIVMELLEGETLRERLRSGALPVQKATVYAQQIAGGLVAAHDKGFVHCDLKPENIFIRRDEWVKILDFGLARLMSLASQTQPGELMGSIGYMSPEQILGTRLDPRSDIFSFGAMLYEMLTGRRAFQADTFVGTLNATLHEDPPALADINRDISPTLDLIVGRCLKQKSVGKGFCQGHSALTPLIL